MGFNVFWLVLSHLGDVEHPDSAHQGASHLLGRRNQPCGVGLVLSQVFLGVVPGWRFGEWEAPQCAESES